MPLGRKSCILIVDQGTSSTKVFLFNQNHSLVFTDRIKHHLIRPAPYHVETDPLAIGDACNRLIREAVKYASENGLNIIRAGMAFQRSTFLFWEKDTLKPLTPALSWQDGRAQAVVEELSDQANNIFSKTGAPLNAHFGGPKFLHMIRENVDLAHQVERGDVFFGPLSAYITHRLTGNAFVDNSIASRYLVMDLDSMSWDESLMALFKMPKSCLPTLVPTLHKFGHLNVDGYSIPLKCVIGDQQAALLGQGGWKTGNTAMNFGTSGSVQIHAGKKVVHVPGLISSILYSRQSYNQFLLEGTINACNSLFHWLEGELGLAHEDMHWNRRCLKTQTPGVFVPGFAGLASPYWTDGISTHSYGYLEQGNINEIIRSAMESIGFLVHDIWALAAKHLSTFPEMVTAGGGGAQKSLLQFIADLTGLKVGHIEMKDRTALGVLLLLSMDEHENRGSQVVCDEIFIPRMEAKVRNEKLKKWQEALETAGVH